MHQCITSAANKPPSSFQDARTNWLHKAEDFITATSAAAKVLGLPPGTVAALAPSPSWSTFLEAAGHLIALSSLKDAPGQALSSSLDIPLFPGGSPQAALPQIQEVVSSKALALCTLQAADWLQDKPNPAEVRAASNERPDHLAECPQLQVPELPASGLHHMSLLPPAHADVPVQHDVVILELVPLQPLAPAEANADLPPTETAPIQVVEA